jgi:beta-glucanase (GH16 family)
VYKLEWSVDSLKWFVDDKLFHSYDKADRPPHHWPFDKPFYILLNIAVGGTWGGRNGVDTSVFPQKYLIDYVRVYKK